jgi:L-amino acid N-acyltransferase YncA
VIARVRPVYRRRGFGEQIYRRGLAQAQELGAQVNETVVLESNDDGLLLARQHGFVQLELPEHTVPFVDLRLNLTAYPSGTRRESAYPVATTIKSLATLSTKP